MSKSYEEIEREKEAIREVNELHLIGFRIWLQNNGLSDRTINKHVSNADLYINHFLLYYEDMLDVERGYIRVDWYLGDWFIRKCWATEGTIKSNAASIKKFYEYMLAVGVVDDGDYDYICKTIKDEMPDWLDDMREHNEMVTEYIESKSSGIY